FGRRASQADPNMRVSHAERTEVADRLSKHYGDGRLDEEEFNERLDRAMKAKTQSDLDGLFDDLPEPEASRAVERSRPNPPGPRPAPAPRDALPRRVGVAPPRGGTGARPPFLLPLGGVLAAGVAYPLAADRLGGVRVVAFRPVAPPLA